MLGIIKKHVNFYRHICEKHPKNTSKKKINKHVTLDYRNFNYKKRLYKTNCINTHGFHVNSWNPKKS